MFFLPFSGHFLHLTEHRLESGLLESFGESGLLESFGESSLLGMNYTVPAMGYAPHSGVAKILQRRRGTGN